MGINAVKYAKKFVDDIQYYTEDAGRADPPYLYHVIESIITPARLWSISPTPPGTQPRMNSGH